VPDEQPTGPALWIVVCGAGPAPEIGRLVSQAQSRGWRTFLIATPSAVNFIDIPALEQQTGNPVRTGHRESGQSRSGSRPQAAAVVVAPATYNTINKWANGIADTYALDILAEAIGYKIPIVVLPFVNANLSGRAPFRRSVEQLRAEGVRVLLGPGQWEPHPPGTGSGRLAEFPWERAIDEVGRLS
jgi:phosphopantothenoylcysteine synthetase/decarboxylase